MELQLNRKWFTDKSTIGELSINGQFECYVLEDRVRAPGVKVYGETAIPDGKYEIAITWSNAFKMYLPLLMNVPMFEGIRIHKGNSKNQTLGCLLVGKSKKLDWIGESKVAFDALFPKLQLSAKTEKIFITINNKPETDTRTEDEEE